MENEYLREFIDYHLNLGYDTIYIYDNNDSDSEKVSDITADYQNAGQVVVIDVRNQPTVQLPCYNSCFKQYSHLYDWMTFIDTDEFITLEKHDNIKDFLAQDKFAPYSDIILNWKCYGDNGKITRELGKGVIERFKNPIDKDNIRNTQVKSIIRCCVDPQGQDIFLSNPHICNPLYFVGCDALANPYPLLDLHNPNIDYSEAYVRHYMTKTIEEYITNKLRKKSSALKGKHYSRRRLTLRYFWLINEKTAEKMAYAKQIMNFKEYYCCLFYDKDNFFRRNREKFRKWKHATIYPFLGIKRTY